MARRKSRIQPRNQGLGKARAEEKLTPNQRMFVEELLASNPWNPSEAAKKAGYKHPAPAASKLLAKTEICRAVGRAIQERIWRCELDANRVIDELSTIAFANIKELFDEEGLLIPIHQLPDSIARAIDQIEIKTMVTDDGVTTHVAKIKLHSKLGALELLAKHLGMLDDRFQVESQNSPSQVLGNILSHLNNTDDGIIGEDQIEAMAQQRLLTQDEPLR